MEKKKRGRPRKAINTPAVDKMVKEPEKKKNLLLPPDSAPNVVIRGLIKPWDLLVERERNIHGGQGMMRP